MNKKFAAMMHALGPLKDDARVKPWIHKIGDDQFIDFAGLFEADSFSSFDKVEMHLLFFAEAITSRSLLGYLNLNVLVVNIDDDGWYRCIEALLILRGVHKELVVLPGQWVESVGGV